MSLDDARGVMEGKDWEDTYFARMEKHYPRAACEEALDVTISYIYVVVECEGDTRITNVRLCDYEA
jgi:hypothetical protein